MTKDSLARWLQKRHVKDIKINEKKKNKNSITVVGKDMKISHNIKTKGWLSIAKIISKSEKNPSRQSKDSIFLLLLSVI